jgi:hypothetical protein
VAWCLIKHKVVFTFAEGTEVCFLYGVIRRHKGRASLEKEVFNKSGSNVKFWPELYSFTCSLLLLLVGCSNWKMC